MKVLQTPDECFEGLPDDPFELRSAMFSGHPTEIVEPLPSTPRRAHHGRVGVVVGIPLFFQALVIYALVVMNTGNGSWVGLGAILLGIPFALICVPLNAAWARRHAARRFTAVAWALATAFLLPVAILGALWAAGAAITALGLHK